METSTIGLSEAEYFFIVLFKYYTSLSFVLTNYFLARIIHCFSHVINSFYSNTFCEHLVDSTVLKIGYIFTLYLAKPLFAIHSGLADSLHGLCLHGAAVVSKMICNFLHMNLCISAKINN